MASSSCWADVSGVPVTDEGYSSRFVSGTREHGIFADLSVFRAALVLILILDDVAEAARNGLLRLSGDVVVTADDDLCREYGLRGPGCPITAECTSFQYSKADGRQAVSIGSHATD